MTLLRVAAVISLIALSLTALSILVPRPYAVIAAMSVGQGLGTFATVLYVWVVIRELRRKRVFDVAMTGDLAPQPDDSKD